MALAVLTSSSSGCPTAKSRRGNKSFDLNWPHASSFRELRVRYLEFSYLELIIRKPDETESKPFISELIMISFIQASANEFDLIFSS